MEPITFTDTLSHYRLKMLETLDHLADAERLLGKAADHTQTVWQGQASQAMTVRLEEMMLEADKAREALEHALTSIEAVQLLALEQGII